METIKFIMFIEMIAMFVMGLSHLIAYFRKQDFPLLLYPVIFIIVLFCAIFAICVAVPLADWFLF
jgi:hypothetical protein